jgi:hypothetical protein
MWMVLSGRPRTELDFSGGGLGAGWGLCWADCTVSMVSRYVRNIIKFENNEQPVQSRHLPAHGPIAVANPPTPSLASPFHTPSYTQRHPIPPLWASPDGAPPCTPGATPVKTAPRPRPHRLIPRFRLTASAYQLCTHLPSRHRQCEWHARRKPRQINGCRSVEHRRHVWRTHAVRHACHWCTTQHAHKLRQKG